MANRAPRTGPDTQVITIFERVPESVVFPVKRFHPIIAPTIAWVVDTGIENLVIAYTVSAAASARVKDPPIAFTPPSLPSVPDVPDPCKTAPRITAADAIIAARRKLIILDPTAEPKMFEASLAPNDQPRKSPLVRKNRIMLLVAFSPFEGGRGMFSNSINLPQPLPGGDYYIIIFIAILESRSAASCAKSDIFSIWLIVYLN